MRARAVTRRKSKLLRLFLNHQTVKSFHHAVHVRVGKVERGTVVLADAFAAALAKEKKAELVTGDPEFKALAKEIKINWLQSKT